MAIRLKKRLITSDLVFDALSQPVTQDIIVDPFVNAGTGASAADVYVDGIGSIYVDGIGNSYSE